MATPAVCSDEAASLLGEVSSFLRLGLVDKAIERLADALRRDPSLRELHELLMKLNVFQHQQSHGDAALTRLSLSDIADELSDCLNGKRPSSDVALTINFHDGQTQRFDVPTRESQAATRQNIDEIEAVAEEIAVTSGYLAEPLREIDECLARQQHSEAQQKLDALATRYPHSKHVRARMKQLFQAQAYPNSEPTLILPVPDQSLLDPGFHSAPTLPPSVLAAVHPPVASAPTGPKQVSHPTLELESKDLSQDSELRTAITLHSAGQYAEAIAAMDKIRDDVAWDTLAALVTGLSYRALGRPQEAIAAFLRGIDRAGANDTDLNRMFYELGSTFEKLAQADAAILYYRLSLGEAGTYFDAAERIAALQAGRTS